MTTSTFSISADADDGSANQDYNTITTGGTYVNLGKGDWGDGQHHVHGLLRFTNVTIPKLATISTAYLQLVPYYTGDASGVYIDIYGDDSDTATFPTTYADYTGKTRTTAKVDFDPVGTTAGSTYNLPEIKTIVQEIVDRSGWASGNAMQFFLQSTGTADKVFRYYTREDATYNEPRLYVEYIWGGNVIIWGSS